MEPVVTTVTGDHQLSQVGAAAETVEREREVVGARGEGGRSGAGGG